MGDKQTVLAGYEVKNHEEKIHIENLYPKKKKRKEKQLCLNLKKNQNP